MKRSDLLRALTFGASAVSLPRASAANSQATQSERDLLNDYVAYRGSSRDIDPADYATFLRGEPRFRDLNLMGLPKIAIILHDSFPEERLSDLGVLPSEYIPLEADGTDPNRVFIVRSKALGIDFILNRGLPGAGGITTQAAELYALGVQYVTHIGTCGLLGERVKGGVCIISAACVMDAAGVMLSDPGSERVSYPTPVLKDALQTAFVMSREPYAIASGYTVPIYYYQPTALVQRLATGVIYGVRTEYVEMEGGALYALAKRARRGAASVVIGVDRYTVSPSGVGTHQYLDIDETQAKVRAVRNVLNAYKLVK
jgi:uridine phosphorylase